MPQNIIHAAYRLALPALLALTAASPACTRSVSERDITGVNLPAVSDATAKQSPDTILIDARTPSAFKRGHLPGARNLTIADIRLDAPLRPEFTQADRIIIYGQDAGDPLASGLALRMLEVGYSNTALFRGGIEAWQAAGRALETQQPTSP